MWIAQGHNEMCTDGESNQGPLGLKSDALSTAPLRPSTAWSATETFSCSIVQGFPLKFYCRGHKILLTLIKEGIWGDLGGQSYNI